ncbi:hypothetical protein EZV62_004453 [Acer yangbiense]|uniref:Uncharacterized protein n=1 Tax=Acer yangbiense TaxID=1000413 RepID=A0A5C7IK00_9ROSI|nr:hypothetical protein EZV62_004453 [Acer yangbiense]
MFYSRDQLEPKEPEIEWHEPKKKEISVRVRLYVHGTILSYVRSKSNQYSNIPLIQIDGVKTKQEVTWYVRKSMTYIYKAEMGKNTSLYCCIWGKEKKISVRVGLYVHGTILGYGRSKSNKYSNTPLIQIGGVKTKQDMTWYDGKTMTYIYKVEMEKNGSRYCCILGKVTRFHGNSGVAQARFKLNKPPKSIGSKVRVFMYPSNI